MNNVNSVTNKEQLQLESDLEFIKGEIVLIFTSQGQSGYYEVIKGDIKRKFSIEKYFDFYLRNAEFEIDNTNSKKNKIQIAYNTILRLRKDYLLDENHSLIKKIVQEKIDHLEYIIQYISNTYQDEALPYQDKSDKPLLNRTKDIIEKEFKDYKEKCFTNNNDYELFIELLTNFFENKTYKIPSRTIALKRGCKTKIATVFNPIHKTLIEKTLKNSTEYFEIIRILKPFSNKSDSEIYKDITR